MPPDARSREVAAEWMRRARSNLVRAKQPKPEEAFWEDFCFDAQQAAEKAVKAILVFHGVDFPRTHRISELLALLNQAGHVIPASLWEADRLSDYAIVTRYPGSRYPVDQPEHGQAVELSEQVLRWAERMLHTR